MGGQITERPRCLGFLCGERRQPSLDALLDEDLFVGAATRMAGFHPRFEAVPVSAGVIRKRLPRRGLVGCCCHDGFLSTLEVIVYVRLGDGLGGRK